MDTFKNKGTPVSWTPATLSQVLDIWARVMPVAVIYANSGLPAAVATAWSLALDRGRNDFSECMPDQSPSGARPDSNSIAAVEASANSSPRMALPHGVIKEEDLAPEDLPETLPPWPGSPL